MAMALEVHGLLRVGQGGVRYYCMASYSISELTKDIAVLLVTFELEKDFITLLIVCLEDIDSYCYTAYNIF